VTWAAPSAVDASVVYLHQRLAVIEACVRAAVERRRAVDADPDDRFRGLYISEAEVDELLAGPGRQAFFAPLAETAAYLANVEAAADEAEAAGEDLRLRRLARSFRLDALDVELLLVSLAPDLDPRFERLYAYLHDDVSRRRASTGLALELCGAALGGGERRRLGPQSPLIADGLLLIEETDRPFLTRSLRVPDRVTAHLLGDDTPDPLIEMATTACAGAEVGDVRPIEQALRSGARLVYIQEPAGGAALSMAAAAFARVGMPVLALDLARLAPDDDVRELSGRACREARLLGAGIVAGPVDALANRAPENTRAAEGVRALAEARSPLVLVGSRGWDPQWSREVPLVVESAVTSVEERSAVWRSVLDGAAPAGTDPAHTTAGFRLTPEQIHRAARAASLRASAAGRGITPDDLRAGARAQNAAGLERLARRIAPKVAWDDLVLPAHVVVQLQELVARVRQRDQVLDAWGLGARSSKGRGIKALFAGDSGTGKTISAEVVAHDLGLDLYVIDLSTVIDKYVGETEKNLDRIFAEADRLNGVLLFDEADALFGKRSEVKDAQDRYANVEVAYLLQRMELFDGLAVLTTNLRSNIDDAFARRLDAIVDFPMPEDDDRRRLWEQHLRPGLPRSADVDLDFLAGAFKISGGNIRNIVLAAAFLAAEADRPVTMADLVRATEREYRKLGHLVVEREFGTYYDLVATAPRTGG
jgi:winged helix domain-containing protein/ATPase family protein associated with various cellular activities (AAA)